MRKGPCVDMKISPEHQRQILQIMQVAVQEMCRGVKLQAFWISATRGAYCVAFVPNDSDSDALMTDDSIECQYLRMAKYMLLIDQSTRIPGMDDWVMYFGFDSQVRHVFKTAWERTDESGRLSMVLPAIEWSK